jgi:hypothetical protein
MLSVVTLNVIMLSVVMLNVVAPANDSVAYFSGVNGLLLQCH